jgi:hypothetical protein
VKLDCNYWNLLFNKLGSGLTLSAMESLIFFFYLCYLFVLGMANHLVRYAAQQTKARITPAISQVRAAHDHAHEHHAVGDPVKAVIGNREIVGFGMNGQPNYIDRVDFPLPAIRYKEVTPDIQVGSYILCGSYSMSKK